MTAIFPCNSHVWSHQNSGATFFGVQYFFVDTTFRESGAYFGIQKLFFGDTKTFFVDTKTFLDTKNFFWDTENFCGNTEKFLGDTENFFWGH